MLPAEKQLQKGERKLGSGCSSDAHLEPQDVPVAVLSPAWCPLEPRAGSAFPVAVGGTMVNKSQGPVSAPSLLS